MQMGIFGVPERQFEQYFTSSTFNGLSIEFWNKNFNYSSMWVGGCVFAWRDSYRETTHNVNKILFDARFQPLFTPVCC